MLSFSPNFTQILNDLPASFSRHLFQHAEDAVPFQAMSVDEDFPNISSNVSNLRLSCSSRFKS